MKINRRAFLSAAAACGCGAVAQNFLRPSLLFAANNVGGGRGDNLIHIVLNGGFDGAFMFEFIESARRSAMAARRQQMLRTVSSLSTFGDPIFGLDPRWGTPSSGSQVNNVRDMLERGEAKLLSSIGHIQANGEPYDFRSHPQALNWLMAGADYSHGNQWMQRLTESENFSSYQSFRFGDSPGMPFLTGAGHTPPISLPTGLNDYSYDQAGMKEAAKVLMKITEMETNLPAHGEQVKLALLKMDATVPIVQLIPEVQLTGSYFGGEASLFGDAAKILMRRAQGRGRAGDPFNDSGKSIIQIGLWGFDMHGDVITYMPGRIESIAKNLAALRKDLKATPSGIAGQSVWDRTTIVMSSEFGRSLFGFYGSEHGQGNISILLGGGLSQSSERIIGPAPTVAELQRPDLQSQWMGLPVHIDYRDVFWEALVWMGLDPVKVFPNFTPRTLNAFA